MKNVTDIFKSKDCTLQEFSQNPAVYKDTKRIKVKYLDDNKIEVSVDMTGKDVPRSAEVTFYFKEKVSGDLVLLATQDENSSLSCMEVYTKKNQIGTDVRLYMGKYCVIIPLRDDDKITFKFTEYSNHGRAGKVIITCVGDNMRR